MDTNKVAGSLTGYYSTGSWTSPKTTTKTTTTVKKKFDKEGRITSETTVTTEESVTTYNSPYWTSTNGVNTNTLGEATYK